MTHEHPAPPPLTPPEPQVDGRVGRRLSARGPDPLRWDVIGEHKGVRVAPVGELDLASTDGLRQAIHELRRSGIEHVILDLRRVNFIDSTGLRLALDLHAAANGDGLHLELLPSPPHVQRIFELTGTLDELPFVKPRT